MRSEERTIDLSKESQDPFQFLVDVTRRHGDAVKYTGPHGTTYLLNHPDYIGEVLKSDQFQRTSLVKVVLGEGMLASDGDIWRKQRRRESPFFGRDAIRAFEPLIQARTNAMLERWAEIAERGAEVDVADEMTDLTLAIIIDGIFGINLDDRRAELRQALDVLLDDVGAMGCTQLNTPLTFSASGHQRFKEAIATLDRIVGEIIELRRQRADDPGNLLSFLLSVRDEETGKGLTERELRDEVVTMMIAGHETTSLILSWAWCLLASHADVERCLHQELDKVLGTRRLNLEDLEHLPYSSMVLQESMRLYPPVWFIARKSMYAGDVGRCHIPENVLVVISPYAIHRHPEFWATPDQCEPSRFASARRHAKFSYIPFGGGRHQCLGMNLALMEGHMILASVAQQFKVQPVPGHVITPRPAITLRLRGGLPATLSRRLPDSGTA